MPGLALQLLGRFQVRRDGEEVPPAAFGGRKVRTLLRVLAVRRPDLVPHEVLAAHRQHPQERADLAAAERRRRHLLAVAAHLEPPQQLQGHVGHGAIVLARRRTASNPQSRVPTVVPTTSEEAR